MGRGTFNLYTSWTPIGDVPLELGGLMILENSHCQKEILRAYLQRTWMLTAPTAGCRGDRVGGEDVAGLGWATVIQSGLAARETWWTVVDRRVQSGRCARVRHGHGPRQPRQPDGSLPPLVGFALPAGNRLGG